MLRRPATSAREQFGKSRHSVLLFLQPFKGSFMPPPFLPAPAMDPMDTTHVEDRVLAILGSLNDEGEPARAAGHLHPSQATPAVYLSDPAVASATTGSAPRRPPYRHRPSLKQPLEPCRPTLRGAVVACHRAVLGRFGAAQLRPSGKPALRGI